MANNFEYTELFVPGRLCLFGEHSDWAGTNRAFNSEIAPGCAIVTGTQQGIYGKACKAETFSVTSLLDEYKGSSFDCPMDLDQLSVKARSGGYFSYVAGVASYICEWYNVGGIHLEITKMDLPMKKGLSSSAAICVLVAQAFNLLYHLNLNTMGIMNIAYWGEQRTPSRCGRLDQACAFGVRPVSMKFDGNEIRVERITVKNPLYYVFADLMAYKDTVKILADLNSAYPFARNEKEKALHEALGADNEVITSKAKEFITNGEYEKLGRLMTEAQKLFDSKVAPMCPDQLRAPILHSVLNDQRVQELTYGAKGVGSQGDGTVQFLAKDEVSQSALIEYLQRGLGKTAYPLTLMPQKAIRKAIIPVAGFGTRLYPETRFVKKEFCPVVDNDGFAKPILLVLLEELDSVGIEEICLVINPDEESAYNDLLMTPIPQKHYDKLSDKMRDYEDKILRITRKIRFVKQNEPKGFGHAVYQAAEFANNEPVLLLLGDTIYRSNTSKPCTKQLIDAFETYGKPIVALQRIPLENVSNYGIFSGKWDDQNETVLRCSRVVEKPNSEFAREYMSVSRKKEKTLYLGAFGSYILTENIFQRLQYAISHNEGNHIGEIDLSDAFVYVAEQQELMGFLVDGTSYDLGNAMAYQQTIATFTQQ